MRKDRRKSRAAFLLAALLALCLAASLAPRASAEEAAGGTDASSEENIQDILSMDNQNQQAEEDTPAWQYPAYPDVTFDADSDEAQYSDTDPNDTITKHFDVTVTADEDHTMHFREVIDEYFVTEHHGITRYINLNDRYRIENIRCEGYPFTVTEEEDRVLIRVGSESELLQGNHEYVLTYDLVYRSDRDAGRDMLSLDLLPTDWSPSIRESTITFKMPKKVDPDRYDLYIGSYGSTETPGSDVCSISEDGRTIRLHLVRLLPGVGVTVRAELPEGYWQPAENWMTDGERWLLRVGIVGAAVLLIFLLTCRKIPVTKTVEFYPPDGMTPADVGYLIDGKVDNSDLGSMILYYAAKGYLQIHEYGEKKYEIIQVSEIDPGEPAFAAELFQAFFRNPDRRDNKRRPVITLEHVGGNANGILKAKNDLIRSYRKEKFLTGGGGLLSVFCIIAAEFLLLDTFREFPLCNIVLMLFNTMALPIGLLFLRSAHVHRYSFTRGKRIVRTACGIVPVLTSALTLGWLSLFPMAESYQTTLLGKLEELRQTFSFSRNILPVIVVEAVFLLAVMAVVLQNVWRRRTAPLLGRVLGYRDFLRDAEYDQMKELSDQDPAYYYKTMPYAYVLGLQTKFAEKFADIPLDSPFWYSSDFSTAADFTPDICARVASSVGSQLSGSISSSSMSGDIGGSGGGFSGGGDAGGGGGAW